LPVTGVRVKKLVIILPLLVLSLVVSGCTDYIPIPEVDNPFPEAGAEEVYDDVFPAPSPGVFIYRANIRLHVEGRINPWPPVKSTYAKLKSWYGSVGYRDYIRTGVGETRHNIFFTGQPDGFREASFSLYATSVPPGMELSQYIETGSIESMATVLVIKIGSGVMPGRYKLEIGLNIMGRDYGTVPCVIEVVG
jgi:hypothetical protein